MQSDRNIVLDGKSFPAFEQDGVYSLEYVEYLMRNHSDTFQDEDEEDVRSIHVHKEHGVTLDIDLDVGEINFSTDITDLIDSKGRSVARTYGVTEMLIDIACDNITLTAHH